MGQTLLVAQTQVSDPILQIACNYLVINYIPTPSQLPMAFFPLVLPAKPVVSRLWM